MKRWFIYNLRWATALLVAGLFSCWTRRGWVRIFKAFALWFGLVRHRGRIVSSRRYKRRMKACEGCPIFYRPLRTCGTPLDPLLRAHGCWCYQPEAAKLADKECYLDAEIEPGYPGGWKHAGA